MGRLSSCHLSDFFTPFNANLCLSGLVRLMLPCSFTNGFPSVRKRENLSKVDFKGFIYFGEKLKKMFERDCNTSIKQYFRWCFEHFNHSSTEGHYTVCCFYMSHNSKAIEITPVKTMFLESNGSVAGVLSLQLTTQSSPSSIQSCSSLMLVLTCCLLSQNCLGRNFLIYVSLIHQVEHNYLANSLKTLPQMQRNEMSR